jgi:hypothetical protein
MDSLPSDVLLELFDIVRPLDSKHLRLAIRRMAAAKLRIVRKEAHLVFKAESFERSRAIASDPLVGKHVKKLFCEADRLPKWEYDEWELRTAPYLPSREYLSSFCGEEEKRTTLPDSLAGADHDPWTDEERRKGFMAYRLESEEQDQISLKCSNIT